LSIIQHHHVPGNLSPSNLHHGHADGRQRLRGAIDARIAEEQARQKATQPTTPSRSSSTARRSNSRNLSPSKRTARSKDGDSSKAAPAGTGPDPSEFDPEFVIGEEDDQPSRAGTPRPKEKAQPAEDVAENGENGEGKKEEEEGPTAEVEVKPEQPPELPRDIQLRLRRLDKLDPKYTGG
jgi:hypothetical protein